MAVVQPIDNSNGINNLFIGNNHKVSMSTEAV